MPPLFISTVSRWSVLNGVDFSSDLATPASGSGFPGANNAIFYPFAIPFKYPIKRFFCWNGSSVTGNIDIGIYSKEGGKLVSTGSVAQAGLSQPQYVTANYLLQPGSYYMALGASAAAAFFRATLSLKEVPLIGTLQMSSSAFPLPAVATFVAPTHTRVFLFGFTLTESGH